MAEYQFFRGYVPTKNKHCLEKYKDRTDLKGLDDVADLPEYAGILATNTILVDLDDAEQAEILMKIVEALQLNCRVYQTTRGKHFLFTNTKIPKCSTHSTLAIGLAADIKVGFSNSYEVLKFNGKERFIEWDIEDGQEYQEIPKWLFPVKASAEFLKMKAGDGRNQSLYNYILTLQANDFSVEECRECIRLINDYILPDPLSEQEIETILRDDAFKKPVFFRGQTFLFDRFAVYLKNNFHICRVNNQLHIYNDGIYSPGYSDIESAMIQVIPDLKAVHRNEVLKYLEILIRDNTPPAPSHWIAFRNGVLNVRDDSFVPPSPDLVVTNRIPWDYNPEAFDDLTDKTLNKIACNDPAIRALLEESAGYCLFKRNELGKAFILTGGKRNGKSTFLSWLKDTLGERNISALDLKELSDRFSTAMMFGKLANIGDDIGDDFLQGSQVAMFKKIVAGNRIKAEQKGQDPFEFNPYVKLLFSANDIPRMKDKTGAVLDRLIIIPFDAVFEEGQPGFNKNIYHDLKAEEPRMYLLKVGIEGLKRIYAPGSKFTKSSKVQKQLDDYESENNPILGFIQDADFETEILHEPTNEVYRRYTVFCAENNMNPMSKIQFSKVICKQLKLIITDKRVQGKKCRVFEQG